MLIHLGSKDILSACVALLQNLSLFGLRNNLLLHRFGDHRGVLLDPGNELSFTDAFMVSIKGDGFHKLEIIPINITFFYLFTSLLFLTPSLLLFGLMVLKYQSTSLKGLLWIAGKTSKAIRFLIFHLENICIGSYESHEVIMMLRRSTKELELRIVLLSFAQSQKKILAIFSGILSGMLYNCYFSLCQFFRELRNVFFWIWLF